MEIFLEEMLLKQFKLELYKDYKKIFKIYERKPYSVLKHNVLNGIMKILAIKEDDDTIVGFMLVTFSPKQEFIFLEYFAILPKYQSKGYGSKALQLLKEYYHDSEGIVLEVETVGYGKNQKENEKRKRRQNFYERNGYTGIKTKVKVFNKNYTIYFNNIANNKFTDKQILNTIKDIYVRALGERRGNKVFKIMTTKNI